MSNLSAKNKYFLILFFALFLYSTTTIFSKLASNNTNDLSIFFVYYAIIIVILGVYAILWQQILRNIDLSVAMSCKPLVLVLNCLWATLLFKETITIKMMLGILLIIAGLVVIGTHNE